MVGYKETARGGGPVTFLAWDPYYLDNFDPIPNLANDYLITDAWRRNVIKPPEDELVGVMTIPPEGDGPGGPHQPTPENGGIPIYSSAFNTVEFETTAPTWLLAGTEDQKLYNLIGNESDELYRGVTDPYPNHNPTVIVASSAFFEPRDGLGTVLIGTAETTFYTMQGGGAKVFAASGQVWAWGLDNWGADSAIGPVFAGRLASMRSDAQRITQNILSCFSVYTPCGS